MYSSVCNLLSMVHYSAVSSAESKHKSGWASQRGAFYTDCQDTTLLATIYKERRGGPALELTLSQMIEPKLKFFFLILTPVSTNTIQCMNISCPKSMFLHAAWFLL